jgi:hypothetical protein
MKIDILITFLSWEDRYILGLEKNLQEFNPQKVILLKNNNPLTDSWKNENFLKTKSILGDKLDIVEIDSLQLPHSWNIYKEVFRAYDQKAILVDITTMTREFIWYTLYNCKINDCITYYIYYKPAPGGYASDWISRNPGKPRLLYKMSGIAKLGLPSLLLVTGGYDIQRLDSLIYYFEPTQTILLFQRGKDPRNKDNLEKCRELFKMKYKIELIFEYDPYNIEDSISLILSKLSQNGGSENYIDNYNIILNSLGAKPSAITLFNVWLKYPQVALSYIPSKEYNEQYSKGIGEPYFGQVMV